jgi:hypothetical protein
MRAVGAVYLLMFVVAAIVRLPIQVMGPEGVLDLASSGEPTAKLLVDTWFTLGLEFGVIGLCLLVASREPRTATALMWTVMALELGRGIVVASYMIARGYEATPHLVWILVHTTIIVSGFLCLRADRRALAGSPARAA